MRTLRYRQIVYNNVHSAAWCVRKINEILKNYNHNYEWSLALQNQLLKTIYDSDYHLNFTSRRELKVYQNQSEYFC